MKSVQRTQQVLSQVSWTTLTAMKYVHKPRMRQILYAQRLKRCVMVGGVFWPFCRYMPCRYKSARKLDQTEIIHIRSKQLSSWPMSGICKCDILLLMTMDCLGMSWAVPGVTFHIKRNHLDDKCSWEIQCFGGFGQPVPQAQMVSIRLSLQNGWMRNTGKHPSRWQIIANQITGTCWRHSLIDCFTAYRP